MSGKSMRSRDPKGPEWFTGNNGITHQGQKPSLGPISEGTLNLDDLLTIFSIELRMLTTSHAIDGIRLASGKARSSADVEFKQEVLQDLIEALNGYGPVGMKFGVSEQDGACFGWWPSELEDRAWLL